MSLRVAFLSKSLQLWWCGSGGGGDCGCGSGGVFDAVLFTITVLVFGWKIQETFSIWASLQGNRGKVEWFEGRRGKDKQGAEQFANQLEFEDQSVEWVGLKNKSQPLSTRIFGYQCAWDKNGYEVFPMLPMPMLLGGSTFDWWGWHGGSGTSKAWGSGQFQWFPIPSQRLVTNYKYDPFQMAIWSYWSWINLVAQPFALSFVCWSVGARSWMRQYPS